MSLLDGQHYWTPPSGLNHIEAKSKRCCHNTGFDGNFITNFILIGTQKNE